MPARLLATVLLAAAALPAAAQSSCSSDRAPRPVRVLERFINADCETCWQEPATPRAGKGELAIDWVLPGSRGEDAPLSVVARSDAAMRLEALGRKAPPASDSVRSRLAARGPSLRVAQGMAFNDYVGTSIELKPARKGPWDAWLILVEALPAGAEGSPVPRNLVRNVFRPDWDNAAVTAGFESRAMQVHEGTDPSRLRLVALLHDARGRLVGATQSLCR